MERYPLTWPAGWPRTPRISRKTARFAASEFIYRDQRSADGSVSTVRQRLVRAPSIPYSAVKEPDDAGAAVYWIKRGWTSHKALAIDLYSRVADNIAALAATIDALRAVERHGGAVVLERAFTGFDALPAPETLRPRAWFDVLECREDSSIDVVAAQYRRKRSDAHPDRGGSTAAFDEVQRAYQEACRAIPLVTRRSAA